MSDDIEGAWNEPMRGEQVGPWCLDLLEALLRGDGAKGKVHAERLATLDHAQVIEGLGYVAVTMMLQLKNFLPWEEADERLELVISNTRRDMPKGI